MSEEYWERYRSTIDDQVEKGGLSESLAHLPSAGKPLPGAGAPYREGWWLREFVGREDVPREAYLPTSLRLRKELEDLDETVTGIADEVGVRATVTALNDRIRAWLRAPTPPHVALATVSPDDVVARWSARRAAEAASPDADPPARAPEPERGTSSWWRRLRGRRRSANR